MTSQDRNQLADETATCRNCGGTASRRRGGGGSPVGWYGLTVSVPEWYTENAGAEPYVWVGQFCGSECLIAYGPEIARMEALARQAYDAVVPEPPVRNPARRKEPRP